MRVGVSMSVSTVTYMNTHTRPHTKHRPRPRGALGVQANTQMGGEGGHEKRGTKG
jgi:hypothetical protein